MLDVILELELAQARHREAIKRAEMYRLLEQGESPNTASQSKSQTVTEHKPATRRLTQRLSRFLGDAA